MRVRLPGGAERAAREANGILDRDAAVRGQRPLQATHIAVEQHSFAQPQSFAHELQSTPARSRRTACLSAHAAVVSAVWIAEDRALLGSYGG